MESMPDAAPEESLEEDEATGPKENPEEDEATGKRSC